MLNWISVNSEVKPPFNRLLICYCPDWNEEGYQIAQHNGRDFWFDGQPNDMFNDLVLKWCLLLEVE